VAGSTFESPIRRLLYGVLLAILLGILSGTYSSIFIATPLLVVWKRHHATSVANAESPSGLLRTRLGTRGTRAPTP
jgi:hypothetical protein